MKKLFALLLVLCFWLPLCAFKDVVGGAVLNSQGSVNEVVIIRYSSEDAEQLGVTFDALHLATTQIAKQASQGSIKAILETKFQTKVATSDLTTEEKTKLLEQVKITTATQKIEHDGQFVVNITYETKSAWNWFCSDVIDKAEETTKSTLFIKNYITKMPIKISSITDNRQEVSLLNYAYSLFTTKLSQTLQKDISSILSTKYSYVYATNVARLHSDAQTTEYETSTGLTYFIWDFNFGEENQITIWQTRANAVAWYCLALGLTAILGVILFVASKTKKKTSKNDTF